MHILPDNTTRPELERDMLAQGFGADEIRAHCDWLEGLASGPRMVASGHASRHGRQVHLAPWGGVSPSSCMVIPQGADAAASGPGVSPSDAAASSSPCAGSGADAWADGGLVGGNGKPQGWCSVCGGIVDVVTVGERVVLDVHGGE